jgi:hypothetical protein
MKPKESDVTIIAAIGPDEKERVQEALNEAFAHRAPHDTAVATRALIYFLGE